MPMRLPRGWRMGTRMNRTLVIVVALSVFFSIGPLADEIPSGFDPGSSKAKGLILTFNDWPPDGVDTAPLLRTLHSAGLKAVRKLPRFRVWVFEWVEWQEGRRAENLCIELVLDDRTVPIRLTHTPTTCSVAVIENSGTSDLEGIVEFECRIIHK